MLAEHASPIGQELLPVFVLVLWTLVVWLWLYLTRIPAMKKAQIHPDSARHPGSFEDKLPSEVRAVADNYNHLHEQPTIFYALSFYLALSGGIDPITTMLMWAYVAGRVVHSLVQIVIGKVLLRFIVFASSSLFLFAIALKEIARLVLG